MTLKTVLVAIRVVDKAVHIMAFLTRGRGSVLPPGAAWSSDAGWWEREPTELNIMREIESSAWFMEGAQIAGWRILADGAVPPDRTYRDAWVDDGASVTHDMPAARLIHRNLIRKHRAAALRELDAQWMRATGQGKKKDATEIEAQRQKWRDAPADPRIDAAQTVEQLRSLMP